MDSTELQRKEFEEKIRLARWNIQVWVNYAQWEESQKDYARVRSIWERAIKEDYRNHTLWVKYAEFEMKNKFVNNARNVWDRAVTLLPRVDQLWYKYIHMEEILGNIAGARQIFERWMNWSPDQQGWLSFMEIELNLGNIDRCRKLYELYLDWSPENCYVWRKYTELEMSLSETDRARAIFELAISQPALDNPELLWKAYIDFEISERELERTRALYERLLDCAKYYKVWVSFAKFEASAAELDEEDKEDVIEHKKDCIKGARAIFDRANTYYRDSLPEQKEERAKLLEDWLEMETSFGNLGDVSIVQSKLPKKLTKRKLITKEDGSIEYEEYIDYLYPEESQTTNHKILEAAYKWKKQKIDASEDQD